MTHPRLYKFHWIGTARGLTGGRFTLCSVWLFGVLLLQIPFTHSVSSNQAARPPGGQDHGRDPGPGASFFLLLRSFCYFSDHYHLSRGEGGEYEKGWNGISQFCYFRPGCLWPSPQRAGTTGVSAYCPPQPPRTEHPSANQATWQESKRLAGPSITGSQLRRSRAGLGTRSLPALKMS